MRFKGVQSGQGAVALGGVLDQTGNLLNTNTSITTASIPVATGLVNGNYIKRFGSRGVSYTDAYNYDKRPPDVYPQSVWNWDVGNRGEGSVLGYGPREHMISVNADVSAARELACRPIDGYAHLASMPDRGEVARHIDRSDTVVEETLQDMVDAKHRARIRHLLASGFKEEEVMEKLQAERRVAIEQAARLAPSSSGLDSVLSRIKEQRADRLTETSGGDTPALRDEPSGQRAFFSGGQVALKKRYAALNQEAAMVRGVAKTQPPASVLVSVRQTPMEMVPAIAREASVLRSEKFDLDESQRDEQRVVAHQEQLMSAALGKALRQKAGSVMSAPSLAPTKVSDPLTLARGSDGGAGAGLVRGSVASSDPKNSLPTLSKLSKPLPSERSEKFPARLKTIDNAKKGGQLPLRAEEHREIYRILGHDADTGMNRFSGAVVGRTSATRALANMFSPSLKKLPENYSLG
jgi:hypothetical protein